MEFFGVTLHGPQNSFKDILKYNYKEPRTKADVQPLMEEIISTSTLPKKVTIPLLYWQLLNICFISNFTLIILITK